MKKNQKTALFLLLFGVAFSFIGLKGSYAQATYTSAASGNWTVPGTWSIGATPDSDNDGVPDSNDIVIINSPYVVTVSDGNTAPSTHACQSLTINNGGTLRTNSGTFARTLNVATSLTIASGGIYTVYDVGATTVHLLNIGGTFTNNGGTFTPIINNSSLQVTFNGTGAQAINGTEASQTFNDVVVNKGGGTLTVGGSTTTLGVANFTETLGNFTAPTTLIAAGTVTLTAGTYTAGANTNIAGNFTHNGGAFTAGAGTVTLNGAMQTIGGSSSSAFNNLTINSGAVTLGIATTANGILAVTTPGSLALSTFGMNSNGLLSITGTSITGTGTLTLAANVQSNASGATATISVPVSMSSAQTFTVANGAASPDLIIPSIISGGFSLINAGLGELTLSGANNFTGGTTLNSGTLNINNASALGTGTFTIAGGTIDNTSVGAITLANNNLQNWNSDFTFLGTQDINLGTGTVSMGANRQVTVNAGTLTIGGTLSAAAFNLTKAGGGTLSFGANNVTLNSLSINAGIFISTSSTLNLAGDLSSSGTFTHNSGTVNFNGGSAQAVAAVNYNNLTLTGAGQKNASGAVSVVSDLNNTSVFDMNTNVLSVTGSKTNTGGTIRFSGTTNGIAVATGTVEYYGATQTVGSGNYSTLNITAAGTKIAGGPITTTNLDNGGVSNVASILDMAGNNLSGTIDNTGASIKFSGASNGLALNTGTVEYNGSTQTIASGTYNNLTINESTGNASLNAATAVNGVLTLNAGNLILGSNNLQLGTGATISVSSPSSSKMIVASGSGEVEKIYSSVGAFTFPLGDSGPTYSPITVNVTSGTGFPAYIGVSVVASKHPNNASATNFLKRYWKINSTITSCVATLSASYVPGDINGTETSIKSAQLDGTFNQSTKPWVKSLALGGNTFTFSGASITASAFTGITGADPTVSISGGGAAVCNGVGVGLTATPNPSPGDTPPAFIYAWSPTIGLSSSTIANPTATPSSTTNYTVTVTDGNGITATNNTTVTVNPLPTLTGASQAAAVCVGNGAVINLSGLMPNSTFTVNYTINSVAQTPVASIVAGSGGIGSFTSPNLTIADNGKILQITGITITSAVPNCNQSFTQNVTLNVNGFPVDEALSVSSPICYAGTANVSITTSEIGVNYQLRNNSNNSIIGAPVAGTGGLINLPAGALIATTAFNVLATNGATGCAIQLSATPSIVVNSPLGLSQASHVDVICHGGATGVIMVSGSGGGGTYEYSRDGGVSWQGSAVFSGLIAGSYTVWVRDAATPTCVYSGLAPIVITQPGALTLVESVASHVNVVCNGGATGVIVVSAGGGAGTYEYSRDGGVSWQGSSVFSGLIAGSYTVWVRDAVTPTCVYSGLAPIVITQPGALTLVESVASHVNVVCNGGATGSLTVSSSGGAGTYEYSRDGGVSWQGSSVFSGLIAGSYTVWVRDAATPTCVYSGLGPIVITQPGALTLVETVAAHVNVVCNGGATGVIVVSAGGGAGTYEYSRDGGVSWQGSSTFSGLIAGSYTVWVRDAVTPTCVYSGLGPIVITQPGALTLVETVAAHVNVVCNGGATGVIVVSAGGGAGTYEYSRDGGVSWQGSAVFSGLIAGSYTVWVRDAATPTCVYSGLGPIVITQPGALTLVETVAAHVNVVCNGGATGVIVVSAGGGAGTYEYSRDGGVSWQGSSVFSGLIAGSYTVWVRDAATPTCVYSGLGPIVITQPGALTLVESVASHVNVVCNGGATGVIVVSAGGGAGTYEYSRDGGVSWQGSAVFSGLIAGSYTVWVRDAVTPTCVYSGLGPIVITQPGALTLVESVASHVNVVCNGGATGSLTVSSSGGAGTYEYSRDGGVSWQGSSTFSGLIAGSYTVWVRDAATPTCVYSGLAPIVITQPGALTLVESVASHVNVVCNGGATGVIVVSAGGGAGTYEYSRDGGVSWQGSSTFSGLIAGSYTVWVRDAATPTCVYSGLGPIVITQPGALTLVETVAAHVNVVCNGGATGVIVVSAGGGAGTYEYSRDGGVSWQGSAVFSGLIAGSYTVWVRDAATPTCVYSGLGPIVITQPGALTLVETVAAHVNVVCNGGATGVIVVSAGGGAGTYEYSRDGGTTWQGSAVFSGLIAGSYTVWVRDAATPTCVYSGLGPIVITQPGALTLVESVGSHVNVVCNGGATGSLTVSSSGGAGTYEYSRDGGVSWQGSSVFSGLIAGSYTVWVRDAVTPTCVYSGLAPIVITQPGALTLVESVASHVNVVCNGGATGSLTVSSSGGAGTYEYSRDGGVSWQGSSVFSGLIAGSYTVWVRDAATPTCVYSGLGPIVITQPGALTLVETVAAHVNVVCNGGATGVIVVSAGGGAGTYEYSRDGGVSWQGSSVFSGLIAGSYTVWVRDAVTPTCVYSGLGPIVITQPGALTLVETVAAHVNVVCNGGATGVIVVSAGGGAGTYEYSRDGGVSWQGSAVFSGLIAGSYTVWVRDAATPTCVYSGLGPIVITQPGALTLVETVAAHVNVVCNGGATGVIVVSAGGGAGTYEYSRDGGTTWQGSAVFSGLIAGSYTVWVRDAVTPTCVYSGLGPIVITQPGALTLVESVASHVNVVCNGGATGSLTVSSSGGAGTYEYSRDGGVSWQGSSMFSGLIAGSYTVWVRDAATPTCVYSGLGPIVITQPGALTLVETVAAHVNVVCNGGATGVIVVSAGGGAGTYEYSRDGGVSWQGSSTFSGLIAGSYTVWVRDAATPTCVYSGLGPIVITQPGALTLVETVASHVNVVCNGGATGVIVVSAGGGAGTYEYSRDGGVSWQGSAVFSGLIAGSYTVWVRDAATPTCVYSGLGPIVITQPGALTLVESVGSHVNVVCNGGATGVIVVSAGGGAGTYEYSRDGGVSWQGSSTFSGLIAGSYTVWVRDAATPTCVYSGLGPIVITQPGALTLVETVAAHVNVVCNGGATGVIVVSAGGGAGTYEYSRDGGVSWQGSAVFSGLIAGSYTVWVRDAVTPTCVYSGLAPIVITQPGALTLVESVASHVNVVCNGGATGVIVVSAGGGAGTYEYSRDGGVSWQGSAVFSGLIAGSYTVWVRDAVTPTCVYSGLGPIVITQPGALTLVETVAAHVNVVCNGGATGVIVVSAGGGAGTYEYSRDGGVSWQGSSVFSGLIAGSYTVWVRDAVTPTCVYSGLGPIVITQPGALTLVETVGSHVNVVCNGGATGVIVVSAGGGAGTYEYSRDGGVSWQGSAVFSGLIAGSYTVWVRDAVTPTCVYSGLGPIVITQPGALTLVESVASHVNVVCNGGATGSLTVSSSGGAGTYEYSRDGGVSWQGSSVFSGLIAGSYTVWVRDAATPTCVYSGLGPIVITQPGALTLVETVAAHVNVVCNGGATGVIVVSAGGGAGTYEYSRDGGVSWQGSSTFSGLIAGSYNIWVRDAATPTCVYSGLGPIVITQPGALTLVESVASHVNVVCNGGATGVIVVSAGGGAGTYEYSRDGGVSWQGSSTFSGLIAGSYTVWVRDAATPTCVYSGLGPIVITQPGALTLVETVASHVNVVCNGGATGVIVVSAGGGAGTYEYSRDGGVSWQGSSTFSGLIAGSYTVWVRDAATPTCVYSGLAPIVITQPGALTLVESVASHVNVVCNGGATGVIVVSAGGGAGTYEYSRDGGVSWQGSAVFSGLIAGSYTVWVRDAVTPTCVYSGLGPIVITQPGALTLVESVASHVNVVCNGGATGVIVVSAGGGAGTYEYSRDGGVSWQGSAVFSGLIAGSYTVWVRDAVTPTCVYSGLGPIVITQPGALTLVETVAAHVNVVCNGGATGVIVVSAGGGAGTYEYSRDGGVSWQGSSVFSGLIAGSYTVWVRDAATPTCVYSGLGPIVITQPGALTLVETVASHVNVVCNGGATGVIVVSAGGGAGTYEYSRDGGVSWQGSAVFSGLIAGSYTVWVRDAVTPTCVYSGLGPIVITQPGALTLVESVGSHVNVVCNGGATGVIVVSAGGGAGTYEYSRDGGVSWQGSSTFSGLIAGSYTVWVRDAATPTCVYSGLGPIVIIQPGALTLVETVAAHVNVVCNGGATGVIVVSAGGGAGTYEYSRDGGVSWQGSAVFSGLIAGSYTVWVRDAVTPTCVYSGLAPIVITQPGALTLVESVASHVNVVCNGGATGVIVVSAGGGAGTYEYSRDGGVSWQGSAVFSGLIAGSYTVWVRDAATPTCVYSGLGPIVITQPGALTLVETVAAHVNVVCNGGATGVIVVSAGGGAGTYEYSRDGGTTWQGSAVFSGLIAGSYTVWVRDAVTPTCVYSGLGPIVITQPGALTLVESVGSHVNVVCNGGATGSLTVSSSGGAGTYEYSRDGGVSWQGSSVFSGLIAGSYTVWVRDAVTPTCVYSGLAPIVITQPGALTLVESVASHVNVVCNGGATGSLTVSSSGGAGTYEYSRDGGVSWQGSSVFSGLIAGSYTVWVRDAATPTCVYSGLGPIVITQPGALTLVETVAAHVNVVCNGGATGVIVVSAGGGAGTYEYSRDGGVSWQGSSTFSGLIAGSYNIWVRDAATPTCVYSGLGPIVITQPGALTLVETVGSHVNVVCNGGATGVIVVSAGGGAGTYEYSRDGGVSWQGSSTFSGLIAGSYTVWVRDAATPTCVYSGLGSISISQPAALGLTEVLSSHVNVVCNGGATGSLTVSSSGGAGTYEYSRDGGVSWQGSSVFSGLIAGSYTVWVRDAATPTCVYSGLGPIVITQPGALTLVESVASHVNVVCNGGATGVIVVSAGGGAGTYEYSRDGGVSWQGSAVFSGLIAGSYTVWVRDAVTPTCVYSGLGPIVITQPGALTLVESVASHVNVVCNGGATGVIVVSAGGGAGTYEYSRDGGVSWQGSAVFSGLIAGSYTVWVRDAVTPTCVYSGLGPIVITQPGALTLVETVAAHVNVVCNGGATGVIVVSAGGGAGTYEYSRDGGVSWQGSSTFSGLIAGSYTVWVRDAATPTCVYSGLGPIVITQPGALTLVETVAAHVNVVCNGGATGVIVVSAGGGAGTYEYSRDGGTTWQGSAVFSGLIAGSYTVWVRDAAAVGCVYSGLGPISINTLNPSPAFTITNSSPIICQGPGSSTNIKLNSAVAGMRVTITGVNATGGVTGASAINTQFNSFPSAILDVLFNPTNVIQSVTYQLQGSIGGICVDPVTYNVVVMVQPVPSATASGTTICSGSNVAIPISAGPNNVLGTTFGWVATPSVNVNGAANGNGSTISQALSLTDYSNGSVLYQITPSAYGCSGSPISITVNLDPIALVNAGADYAVCQPSTILLTGSIGGAATSGTWQIVTGSGSISGSTVSGTTVTATYTVVPGDIATTAIFKLSTNDPDGALPCSAASGILHVAINRAPTVSLPAAYTVCEPSSIALTGTIGGSASTGLWSIVSGAGVLSATNVSGTTVTANYSVHPNDISSVVTFRLTTNDSDGSGPCPMAYSDINITINRAAQVFAPANLALCQDTPGIALGGSIGGSTVTTVWSGGQGSFSDLNNPNTTYTFKNSEINTNVVLTLTAFDPDGVGPCTQVSTQTNLKINPLPVVVFSGFPPGIPTQMAENLPPITLTGNQIGGLFTISPSTSNIGSTSPSPVDRATFDPSAVALGPSPNIVTYTYTDGNGCTNSNSQSIIVNPVTNVDFTIQSGYLNPSFEWEICANQFNLFTVPNPSPSLVKLIGNPVASTGGVPETNFTADVGVNNASNVMSIIHIGSEYYIETNGLAPDTYVVTYTYKNSFNAITSKHYGVIVHAGPNAQIGVANNCISSAIQFNDASPPTPTDPIVFWKWDFADGSAPVFSQNPSHIYTVPKVYKVVFQVATSFGCSDTTSTKVRVGAVPVVKFGASSICNNDSTKYKDLTTNPNNVSRIITYTWDFGDGATLVGDSTTYGSAWNKGNAEVVPDGSAGTFKNPYHKYGIFGTYKPKLTVNTNDGCSNSYQKSIFILPYSTVTPLPTNAYREDFEATDGGYQVECIPFGSSLGKTTPLDSSWLWTVPNGKVINGGSKSWWTGLFNGTYDSAESSVVNGPCFNLSSLARPMLSFDYWINTPSSNNDGAALQYSSDGGNNWYNVGVPSQGINWYSSRLIVSNPGNQPVGLGPYGWSGDSQIGWMKASFNLDGLPAKRSQVRIRFSFAGDSSKNIQGRFNGFAFDNVFVGNKTKNVLIEEFTNATVPASLVADDHFKTLFSQDSASRNGNTDFNGIQYHVRFPQPDIFAQGNSDDPAARALYYGVQKIPYSLIDGIQTDQLPSATFPAGDYNNISIVEIDRMALRTPPLTILQIDTVNTTAGWKYNNHSITAKVNIRADTVITYPLYAQVALIENPVMYSGVRYQNVVRQLLYAGDGVTKSIAMAANDTQIFAKGDVEIDAQIKDSTKLFLIAFVQNFTTKAILQSSIMPVIKKVGSLVTGIEPSVAELEQIKLYPNPANGKISLSVDGGFPSDCIWKISDQRGINVMTGNFNDAVNGVKSIDIAALTNGVYFVAIGAPDRNPVYKKLVVLNSN